MLDFRRLHDGDSQLADLSEGLTLADLHRFTDEMINAQLGLIRSAVDADVVFTPNDPNARDEFAVNPADADLPWSLGHVIVHATASSEEAAARASQMARGVPLAGRNRFEIAWQEMTTVSQLRARLEESRRMRHAFLETWPDPAHLDVVHQPKNPLKRPFNAVGMFLSGLSHDDAHLEQIAEIMRQATAARGPIQSSKSVEYN